MSLKISIDGIDDIAKLAGLFEQIEKRTQTPQARKTIFGRISAQLLLYSAELFKTGGRSGKHGQWAPYTNAEARWKAYKEKLLGHDKPLIWPSRMLEHSLTSRQHPDHIEKISGTDMIYGTRNPGPARRVLSEKWKRKGHSGRIPIRRVIDLTEPQIQHLAKIAVKAYKRQAKLSGN